MIRLVFSVVFMSKITPQDFVKMKGREKIVMVALYDYAFAKVANEVDIHGVLIGDSVIMNVYGFKSTHYATLRDIVRHVQAVVNANPRYLVVGDMPFMTYETSKKDALKNASKIIKAGADAVKVEGGVEIVDKVEALVKAGIPVMGHIGLTPQRYLVLGGYRLMGKTVEIAEKIIEDAKALQDAGVFSIVIEFTAAEVAAEITRRLRIPTICIGSGPECDGQILVINDILGISDIQPFFAKKYVDLRLIVREALRQYAEDVKSGRFPGEEHYRRMRSDEYELLKKKLKEKEDMYSRC